jgi:hypothetical protein
MKTTIKLSILALLAAFTFSSCSKEKVSGTGSTVTQNYSLSNFDKVSSAIDADINYTYDQNYSVSVNAQQNVLDEIIVKKSGSMLVVKLEAGTNLIDYDQITVNVRGPQFAGADLSGKGNINVRGSFVSAAVNIDISGYGKIDIEKIQATNFSINISGNGELVLDNGTTNKLNTSLGGTGKIYLSNLKATNVYTKTGGSGDTEVWATDKLDVDIAGSGDVYYKGNPIITQNIKGAGKVIKL